METIWGNAFYTKELESKQLLGFYYLMAWKGYLEEKTTWELLSAVQYLKKLISSFYKNHPEKPTTTSLRINFVPPMAKPTVKSIKPITKKKQSRSCKTVNLLLS